MNLPRLAVRNPVAVNLLMWLTILAGLFVWFDLVRELFPNSTPERISITIPYPGATPAEVEELVTRRVEREVRDIEGVEEVESRVLEGLTVVELELEDGADRSRVLNDVRTEVDRLEADLPDGTEDPEIVEVRPLVPVMDVVVYGDISEDRLRDLGLELRDDLQAMEGISRVVISGLRDREIWVELIPERLQEAGLTFQQVGQLLAANNQDLPAGQLEGERGNIRVRNLGERRTAREIEELPVLTRSDGSMLRLKDVARVRETFEDVVKGGRFQGKPAAAVTIFKTPEQDALEIASMVKQFIADRPTRLLGAAELAVNTDLAKFIEQRLELMTRNAKHGLILVVIVLALFLDLRVAFWVSAGIPIAFLGTFVFMNWFGSTINLITLFGLIVVLGLIVDDAIVIGENVFTRMREGMAPLKAAVVGTTEVAIPVLAAVLTTVVAFLPLAFMEGQMGVFLGALPWVVIAALSMSLIEAYIILPAHLAHLKDWGVAATFPRLTRAYDRVQEAKFRLFEVWLPDRLETVLRVALQWRYVTSAVGVALLMLTVGLVVGGIVPFVFFQDVDTEMVNVELEMAAGTPVERTVEVLDQLEQEFLSYRETDRVYTVVGSSFGDQGVVNPADPATVGQMWIQLMPADQREREGLKTSHMVLNEIRARTADIPGTSRLALQARSGAPVGPPIEVQLIGDDLNELARAVEWLREELAGFNGVHQILDDLKQGKLEARLRFQDPARAQGLTGMDQAKMVRHALFGYEAQELQAEDEEITVRVLLPKADRRRISNLWGLWVPDGLGQRMPLSEMVDLETARGYASLTRVNGKRAITVSAEVDQDRANANDITTSLSQRLDGEMAERFPGVASRFEGQRRQTEESVGSLAIGFPVALFLIYSIIAMLFRSYLQPFIVMLAIPYSMVGAVAGHFIMGLPFTILSLIGLVALAGIVVNDSLILVDFINRERRSGIPLIQAVVDGSRARLRAILLTSITTCAGLAPLMLERSFQAQFLIPMAVSIVFGLAFATILILVLVPTTYLVLDDLRTIGVWWWTGRWQRQITRRPTLTEMPVPPELEEDTPP